MKKQEQSIIEIMWKCENIQLWTWIWSSFDYITGFQKRAPNIWRYLWLEWMYRLITWPQKIKSLKRLYLAIIVFIYKIIISN
jgi:UDP-N-acetyl-D-mannosaminuronic acid transferase (WecB/TagA/CpsF family)